MENTIFKSVDVPWPVWQRAPRASDRCHLPVYQALLQIFSTSITNTWLKSQSQKEKLSRETAHLRELTCPKLKSHLNILAQVLLFNAT